MAQQKLEAWKKFLFPSATLPFKPEYRLKILADGFEYESQFGNGKVTYTFDVADEEFNLTSIGTQNDKSETLDVTIPSLLQYSVGEFESIVVQIMQQDFLSECTQNIDAIPYVENQRNVAQNTGNYSRMG